MTKPKENLERTVKNAVLIALEVGPLTVAEIASAIKQPKYTIGGSLQYLKSLKLVELTKTLPRVPGKWRLK